MIDSVVHVFVGPTAFRLRCAIPPLVRLHPPAGRGDVARLTSQEETSTLVIVDGSFRERLAVGHRELLGALDQGWTVWGLASMGALRAVELGLYGMRGFGDVFARVSADPHFRDDELALLHGPAPLYEPITEALVNLRALVAALIANELLTPSLAAALEADLQSSWYGGRSLERIEAALDASSASYRQVVAEREWDVKARDLRAFLNQLAC